MTGFIQPVTCLRASETTANYWFWERPKVGCRYIVTVDLAEGEDQTKGENPDRHSALVLRDEYMTPEGLRVNPAVVARVRPPCRLGMIRFTKLVWNLSAYFGKCMVIPEMNNSGMSFITAMRMLPESPPIWQRTEMDPHSGLERRWDGWRTTDSAEYKGLRSVIIDRLQEAILAQTLDIWCPHILSELVDFVQKGHRREAGSGHDDDVLALAIGFYNLGSATEYRTPVYRRSVPHDLRKFVEQERSSGGLAQRF